MHYNRTKIKFLMPLLKLNYNQEVPSRDTTKRLFDRWIVVWHKVVVDTAENWAVEACEVGPAGRRAQY